jgi:hypothetical protein
MVGFGFGTLQLFKNNSPAKWPFFIVFIVGSVFLSFCFRLKSVRIGNDRLQISNFLKKVQVPFANIERVYENKLINIRPVTIFFRERTEFGKKITFMPEARVLFFSSHPIIKELRKKIKE